MASQSGERAHRGIAGAGKPAQDRRSLRPVEAGCSGAREQQTPGTWCARFLRRKDPKRETSRAAGEGRDLAAGRDEAAWKRALGSGVPFAGRTTGSMAPHDPASLQPEVDRSQEIDVKSRIRMLLASIALSVWLILLLTGWTLGGGIHLIVVGACVAFPWQEMRASREASRES